MPTVKYEPSSVFLAFKHRIVREGILDLIRHSGGDPVEAARRLEMSVEALGSVLLRHGLTVTQARRSAVPKLTPDQEQCRMIREYLATYDPESDAWSPEEIRRLRREVA